MKFETPRKAAQCETHTTPDCVTFFLVKVESMGSKEINNDQELIHRPASFPGFSSIFTTYLVL